MIRGLKRLEKLVGGVRWHGCLRDARRERIKDLLLGWEDTAGVTAKGDQLSAKVVVCRDRAGVP